MSVPEDLARELRRRASGQHLLLLVDFDGTLCEFEPDPAAVWLRDSRRRLLDALRSGASVGVISGRRLADVRERCGLPDLIFAGLHGMEIEAFGETFVHPDLDTARTAIDRLRPALLDIAVDVPGAFIEEKGASIALHFRQSDEEGRAAAAARFDAIASACLASGELRLMRGSSVLELLPNTDWNKGHAVGWIRERATGKCGPTFVVYLGDDVTDQHALDAVVEDGLPVAVSDRVAAEARLDGPDDVEQFLRALLNATRLPAR